MHVFDPLDQTLPEVTEVRELSCRLAVSLSARPGMVGKEELNSFEFDSNRIGRNQTS